MGERESENGKEKARLGLKRLERPDDMFRQVVFSIFNEADRRWNTFKMIEKQKLLPSEGRWGFPDILHRDLIG